MSCYSCISFTYVIIYPLKIIGIYTTTHLLMLDNFDKNDAKDALWLDHDVSQKGIKCIGQHLIHHKSTDELPLREEISWNRANT